MTIKEFLNNETSLHYQRDPDGQMSHLDYVTLANIRLSGRETGTPTELPDSARRGLFKINKYLPGSLIQPGFDCQRPLMEINRLWNLTKDHGRVSFRVNYSEVGTETDVENYDLALLFVDCAVNSPGLDGGKALQSGDVARQMATMMAQAIAGYELKPLPNATRLTTTEDQLGNGVYFAPPITSGILRRRAGEVGLIAVDGSGAANANPMRTVDFGATWTAATAQPYGNAEHLGFPIVVNLPQTNQERNIFFRTVTNGAEDSTCAYSDDTPQVAAWGATWNLVDIGSTNAWFITAAIRVHDSLLLCGDDQGNVYYSKDKAVSWTLASYAGTNDVRGFYVAPDGKIWAVGDATEFYYSEDDGENWASAGALTGAGGSKGVAVNHEGYVFVIDGTDLKYTKNENASGFTTVTVTSEAVTALKSIQFDEYGYTGIIVVDDAGGDDRIFRTEDGGMTWIAQTTGTSNTGYNDAFLVTPNLMYILGDVVATTWIEKLYGKGEGS